MAFRCDDLPLCDARSRLATITIPNSEFYLTDIVGIARSQDVNCTVPDRDLSPKKNSLESMTALQLAQAEAETQFKSAPVIRSDVWQVRP